MSVSGGPGGKGGKAGAPGKGGRPGKGGLGCTGLGGTQPNERDGNFGKDGAPGRDDITPPKAADGLLVVRRTGFKEIARIYREHPNDAVGLMQALQAVVQ